MSGEPRATELASLRRCWRRWTRIVELATRQRGARYHVDARAYANLHKELIQACRTLKATPDEAKRAFYDGLENLAQPWLTLNVLERSEQEILFDLLLRCRQAERELGGRRGRYVARLCAVWGLALVAAVAAVVLVYGVANWGWFRNWQATRAWGDSFWTAVKHSSPLERVAVVGLLMLLIGIPLAWRVPRGS
jgi:hypothetical protein